MTLPGNTTIEATLSMQMPDSGMIKGQKSVNTFAISQGGGLFNEANAVTTEYINYNLIGTLFKDINKDSVQGGSEAGVAGVRVHLLDSTGNPVKGIDGNELITTTDVNGKYSFDIAKNGNYSVRFDYDKDVYKATTPMSLATNKLASSMKTDGTTDSITINELNPSGVVNAGLIGEGSLVIHKVVKSGLVTDSKGEIKVADLPYGNYVLVETKAPSGYVLPANANTNVTVDNQSVNVPVVVTNTPKKGQIELTKTADKMSVKQDDTVNYTFTIKNTGNVTLNNVVLDDPMLGGSIPLTVTTLKAGESTTVTKAYNVRTDDLKTSTITNTATVTTNDPGGNTVKDDGTVNITTTSIPEISLD